MGLSRVDIYNLALGRIKILKRVRSVDDETAREFMLSQSWALTLEGILNRHNWTFATVNNKLAKVDGKRPDDTQAPERHHEIAPAAIYRHNWVYPTDCCKLLCVGLARPGKQEGTNIFDFGVQLPWEIEAGPEYARVIKTMHDHAAAQYITNKVPEVYWPATFRDAFIWALAAEITRAINASDSDAEYRMQQAEKAFLNAQSADIDENGMAIHRNGNWIESRERYGDQPIGDNNLFGNYCLNNGGGWM